MEKLRRKLTSASELKYLLWRVMGMHKDIVVKTRDGKLLSIRKAPAQDANIAHELFVLNVYDLPDQIAINGARTIVDVGANVGYSCVLWLQRFPGAKLLAFEPHPDHLRQINLHLKLNGLVERATVIAGVAGTRSGELFLTDRGPESALVVSSTEGTFPVEGVDWFSYLSGEIDLLKIDIEGGEYELLNDLRFQALDVKVCVLEWHTTADQPDGRRWCVERFTSLGYKVISGKLEQPHAGLLWAYK